MVFIITSFLAGVESADQCLHNSKVLSCFSGVIMSIRSFFLLSNFSPLVPSKMRVFRGFLISLSIKLKFGAGDSKLDADSYFGLKKWFWVRFRTI